MLGTLAVVLVGVAVAAVLVYYDRCPRCRDRGKRPRTTDEDGIRIACHACGFVDLIPWEDLH